MIQQRGVRDPALTLTSESMRAAHSMLPLCLDPYATPRLRCCAQRLRHSVQVPRGRMQPSARGVWGRPAPSPASALGRRDLDGMPQADVLDSIAQQRQVLVPGLAPLDCGARTTHGFSRANLALESERRLGRLPGDCQSNLGCLHGTCACRNHAHRFSCTVEPQPSSGNSTTRT